MKENYDYSVNVSKNGLCLSEMLAPNYEEAVALARYISSRSKDYTCRIKDKRTHKMVKVGEREWL